MNTGLGQKANQMTTYTKTEINLALDPLTTTDYVDSELALKTDVLTSYSRDDVNVALAKKADITKTYSRDEADVLLEDKADLTYVDQGLGQKAFSSAVYTTDQTDALLLTKQKKLTIQSPSPLALSATGALSIDLADYNKTAALDAYAKKFTTAPPLALSSGVLSVDLSGYAKEFAVFPPLSMTETTLRSEGVTVVVPTLVIDMIDYLTTSSLYAYQPYLTVLPPLKLEDSLLSFDESRF